MNNSIFIVPLLLLAATAWIFGADHESKETGTRLNKQTVQTYMEGFRRSDHAAILACLTEDVEW